MLPPPPRSAARERWPPTGPSTDPTPILAFVQVGDRRAVGGVRDRGIRHRETGPAAGGDALGGGRAPLVVLDPVGAAADGSGLRVAQPRGGGAAPAVPRSWMLAIGRAGPASCRAGRRPGKAGEETWVIILPGDALPVVPVQRRSRLLEPDRGSAAGNCLRRIGLRLCNTRRSWPCGG